MTRPHPSAETRRVRRAGAGPAASAKHAPPGRPAARAGGGRAAFIAALVAATVASLAFLPTVAYEFVRDDRDLLLEGSLLRAPGTLARLLASDYWSAGGGVSGLWRPFVTLTMWLDGRISGWAPAWFHAANVAAHSMTAFVLARVVAGYGGGAIASWLAGLWFAVMPAHVESVAWVVGRTDLWCTLWTLVALLLSRRGTAARRSGPAAYALALLSKETAAVVAPAFALAPPPESEHAMTAATVPPGGQEGGRWRSAAPYALVLAVWAVLHALLAGPVAATAGLQGAGVSRFWTALALPAWEMRFLLPGVGHGPDWRVAPIASPAPAAFLGAAAHAGAVVLLVRLGRRRDPLAVPLAILWLPLAGMSALALVRGAVFAGERHIYLASAGAAWALGLCLERAMRARAIPPGLARVAFPALAVILVAMSAGDTLARIPAWRNEETMYAAMTRTQPRNATGPLGQALVRIDRGDDAGAWEMLARAAAIDSTRYEVPLYRAGIVLRRGRPLEAIALAREAGALVGWNRDARLIEALALQRLGRWREARPLLEDLRARSPGDADVGAAWRAQLAGEAQADSAVTSPRR